uniref:MBD domain-containing protein n=1 Tax=Strigamia maritima TaxID=126957 RepID=T1JNB4_STRMM
MLRSRSLWDAAQTEKPIKETSEKADAFKARLETWIKNDVDALNIILMAIDSTQLRHVMNSDTAKQAWDSLRDENQAVIAELKVQKRIELGQIQMKSVETISSYLDRVVTICQELQTMSVTIQDAEMCGHILHGLTNDYRGIVTSCDVTGTTILNIQTLRHALLAEDVGWYRHQVNQELRVHIGLEAIEAIVPLNADNQEFKDQVSLHPEVFIEVEVELPDRIVELGFQAVFMDQECTIQTMDGLAILYAYNYRGLFCFESREPPSLIAQMITEPNSANMIKWHRRLAHLNFRAMDLLVAKDMVLGIDWKRGRHPTVCNECVLEKQTRLPFRPIKQLQAKKSLEMLHVDLCGPLPHLSNLGMRYIFMIVDDYSGAIFVRFLKAAQVPKIKYIVPMSLWLVDVKNLLGIRIQQDLQKGTVSIDQKKYMIKHFGMEEAREFLTDTPPGVPPATDLRATECYEERKARAYSTIHNSISKDLRPYISDTRDGREAWDALIKHFEPVSNTGICRLYNELRGLRVETGESIRHFAQRIRAVAKKLTDLVETVNLTVTPLSSAEAEDWNDFGFILETDFGLDDHVVVQMVCQWIIVWESLSLVYFVGYRLLFRYSASLGATRLNLASVEARRQDELNGIRPIIVGPTGFKRNLISIGKIDRVRYHIYIYNDIMKVYQNNSKTCSLQGILDDGLYRVKGPVQYKPAMKPKSIDINYSGTKDCEANGVKNYSVSVDMWHQRFEHMYTKGLDILAGNDQVKGIQLPKKVDKTVCDNCEISKSTRASFKSEHKSVTYAGDTPLVISDGRDTHFIPHDDSGDNDDGDTPPPPPQTQLPTRPPSPPLPKPPLPITSKPLLKVTTRRKVIPSSSAQSGTAATRIALRTPILSKPGWEREEVKRQKGITKGKWDVYFYAPGRRTPLRSRPELKKYCEQDLRIKYNADNFNWVPTQEKPGYGSSDDDVATERIRYREGNPKTRKVIETKHVDFDEKIMWADQLNFSTDSEINHVFQWSDHFEKDTNGTEDQVKRQIPSQEIVSPVQQVVGPPSQPIPSQQPSTSTLSTVGHQC